MPIARRHSSLGREAECAAAEFAVPWLDALAATFDERDDAVKAMLSMAISACRARGKYAGICGQGPSDHPDLAEWLMQQGIESVSLNPDTVVDTWLMLAKKKAG